MNHEDWQGNKCDETGGICIKCGEYVMFQTKEAHTTPEETIRTEAARGALSARQIFIKAMDALGEAQTALMHGLAWNAPVEVSKMTLRTAAEKARLASDLLQALAEKGTE